MRIVGLRRPRGEGFSGILEGFRGRDSAGRGAAEVVLHDIEDIVGVGEGKERVRRDIAVIVSELVSGSVDLVGADGHGIRPCNVA